MIDLDAELAASAPPRTVSRDLDRAVSRLVTRTRPGVRRRRVAVQVGIGVIALGVMAGGAAAATGSIDWVPWLSEPDLAFEFTTPGGLECLGRVATDGLADDDPAEVAALEDVIRNGDIVAEAAEIVQYYMVDDPEAEPDQIYVYAMAEAINRVVSQQLAGRGVEETGWGLQIQCPGAEWYGAPGHEETE